MAIPQTDPKSAAGSAGDGANPASPVKLPEELSGSASTTPAAPMTPANPAAPAPAPAPVSKPVQPEDQPMTSPVDTQPAQVDQSLAGDSTPVVDLDREMKMSNAEPVTKKTQPPTEKVEEEQVDPNIALQNGNTKEGNLEPMNTTTQSASSTPPIPESPMPETPAAPTAPIAEEKPVMSGTDDKATVDELPELASATMDDQKTEEVEQPMEQPMAQPDEPMHETPSQDKLKDIMSTETTPPAADAAKPAKTEKPAEMKTTGGSNSMAKIVLVFLLLGILAISAVLAYLLFA
jgi:hypothetical protein